MRIVINSLMVLGLAGMLFAATAGNIDGSSKQGKDDARQQRILANGDLSEAQHKQIKEIHDKSRQENKEISDKLNDLRDAMKTEMEANPRSETKINKLRDDMKELQVKRATSREKLKAETDSVYTPEQLTKRNERRAEQEEKFKKAKEARKTK